ncbi:adenylate/guanylate cyclase domain-containing protein [Mycobacterium avium subsp. hominissuis]|uniref:adenylate/guanylate cyclase domain-containing protein n=1 Tax=Mycobacterium TaxID=1763 RepID=UPI0009FBE079|nr:MULTISPECIES: adenylate/guanylate cyclase domain-containing protein [Mycobacterium]MDP7706973.1 adenylate/guanylate cyclase domain-containing protein [Mycobacterium sp. TY815]
MKFESMRRSWAWTFDLPPDELWPVLADTKRFNEALGLPPYTLEETPQPNGTILRRGRAKAAGFAQEWEEKPYEWIAGRHFRQRRVFSKGPFRRFGPVFDVEPDGRGGSRVSYTLEWEPLNLAGRLFGTRLAVQAGKNVKRRILEAVTFAHGAAEPERLTPFVLREPVLPPSARERATAMARDIDSSPYGNGLGDRLVERVLNAMAADLARLRPKVLAGELGVPPRAATEACLAGVRAGLLGMRWDLLCPNCRGAKASVPTLAELPHGGVCSSCNIDYDRDFERNVELTFTPSPTVRPLPEGDFCLSGPMSTEHVAVQVLLRPGERRTVPVDLPAGSYRLRTLHPGHAVEVDYEAGAFPGLHITTTGAELLATSEPTDRPGTVTFVNDAGFELAALIEERTWTRETLTAPEVLSLQVFRDLFAEATLRPGDDAGISQVALLFTDLRGSTELYERVGDATAYNLVREHFTLLAEVIRDHDGAVVKTIGDAVMASFDDPAQAVRAALAMQHRIVAAASGAEPLVLKIGVHAGSSVVVTLNDRLDYFGSTVNMTARLQGQSAGGDIILSQALACDPAVREMLSTVTQRRETVALKGFTEPVGFVRLVSCESTGIADLDHTVESS